MKLTDIKLLRMAAAQPAHSYLRVMTAQAAECGAEDSRKCTWAAQADGRRFACNTHNTLSPMLTGEHLTDCNPGNCEVTHGIELGGEQSDPGCCRTVTA